MLEIYGPEHFIYLAVVLPLIGLTLFLVKRYATTPDKLRNMVRIIGMTYLLIMIWNRISTSILESGFDHFFPNLYCGMSGIALSLAMIFMKKDHMVFHCIIYISVLGGLLTMIYPDFIVHSDSIFYLPTISGLIHHSFLLMIPLLLVYTGYVKPDLKKYKVLPIGMAIYITFGVFEITVLGYDDAMYLLTPALEGSMFNWFGFALIFLPTHLAFLVVWKYLPERFKPHDLTEQIA